MKRAHIALVAIFIAYGITCFSDNQSRESQFQSSRENAEHNRDVAVQCLSDDLKKDPNNSLTNEQPPSYQDLDVAMTCLNSFTEKALQSRTSFDVLEWNFVAQSLISVLGSQNLITEEIKTKLVLSFQKVNQLNNNPSELALFNGFNRLNLLNNSSLSMAKANHENLNQTPYKQTVIDMLSNPEKISDYLHYKIKFMESYQQIQPEILEILSPFSESHSKHPLDFQEFVEQQAIILPQQANIKITLP